jgi:hypothetical protein
MKNSDHEKYLVRKPLREVGRNSPARTRAFRTVPGMTYMSNDLVPGSNTYIEMGWIWDMPDPNPHIHEHVNEDHDEIILHIGNDPDNPEDLGAEIEFCVGGQPLVFDKTTALFVPKGVRHGPLTWKRVSRPHVELTITLGAGTLSEAMPAGIKK